MINMITALFSMDDDYYGYDYNELIERFRDNHDQGFNNDDEWTKKHGSEPHNDANPYIRYLTAK